jgi:hypothetical protein
MNAAMLMLVASTMTAPQPAATNDVSASPSFTIGHGVSFVSATPAIFQGAAKPAPPAQKASPTHQMAGKTVTVFVQGGVLFVAGYTGFTVGAGVGFIPMKDHEQFEVNADFNYIHVASTNGWYLTFNGQYNFILANHKSIKPFAGAGLAVGSFNYSGHVALNVFGGVQSALASGRAIRIQIRWVLTSAVTTSILFGIAF